jgi:ATP-dependent Lon protease
MEKTQREYILNEQMKAIQKELGESEDGGRNEITELEEKIKKQELPLIVLDWRIEFTASIKKITEQIYKPSMTYETEIETGKNYIRKNAPNYRLQ